MSVTMSREEFKQTIDRELRPVGYFCGGIVAVLVVLLIVYYAGGIPCPKFVNSWFGFLCIGCVVLSTWTAYKGRKLEPLMRTAPPDYFSY